MKNTISEPSGAAKRSIRSRVAVVAGLAVMMVIVTLLSDAFAQDASWADPVVDVVDRIRAGLTAIAGGLLLVSMIIAGVQYFFLREFQLKFIYPPIVGACLAFLGGGAISVLLGN